MSGWRTWAAMAAVIVAAGWAGSGAPRNADSRRPMAPGLPSAHEDVGLGWWAEHRTVSVSGDAITLWAPRAMMVGGATSSVEVVFDGAVLEVTVGGPGLAAWVSREMTVEENRPLWGGSVSVGRFAAHTGTVAVWEGQQWTATTSGCCSDRQELFALLERFRIRERSESAVVVPLRDDVRVDVASAGYHQPLAGIGGLDIRPASGHSAGTVTQKPGIPVGGGELYEDGAAFLLVGDSAVAYLDLHPSTSTETARQLMADLRVNWQHRSR